MLSTLALAALALAQPVLDLLGQSPEFFVARASPALDVVLVPLVLGVGVPLLLAGVVALVHAVNQRAGRVLHRVLLVLFGGLIVVTLLEHTPAGGLSGRVLLGLGGAAGVALSWGYYRSRSLRSVFRFLAVAPVVVTAVFLLVAPTSRLAWASASPQETVHAPVGEPAPVVMIVFDEFPVASLLDGEGNIQAEHFPTSPASPPTGPGSATPSACTRAPSRPFQRSSRGFWRHVRTGCHEPSSTRTPCSRCSETHIR